MGVVPGTGKLHKQAKLWLKMAEYNCELCIQQLCDTKHTGEKKSSNYFVSLAPRVTCPPLPLCLRRIQYIPQTPAPVAMLHVIRVSALVLAFVASWCYPCMT